MQDVHEDKGAGVGAEETVVRSSGGALRVKRGGENKKTNLNARLSERGRGRHW